MTVKNVSINFQMCSRKQNYHWLRIIKFTDCTKWSSIYQRLQPLRSHPVVFLSCTPSSQEQVFLLEACQQIENLTTSHFLMWHHHLSCGELQWSPNRYPKYRRCLLAAHSPYSTRVVPKATSVPSLCTKNRIQVYHLGLEAPALSALPTSPSLVSPSFDCSLGSCSILPWAHHAFPTWGWGQGRFTYGSLDLECSSPHFLHNWLFLIIQDST